MTNKDFEAFQKLVLSMRNEQKSFFKYRCNQTLRKSIELEKKVDNEIDKFQMNSKNLKKLEDNGFKPFSPKERIKQGYYLVVMLGESGFYYYSVLYHSLPGWVLKDEETGFCIPIPKSLGNVVFYKKDPLQPVKELVKNIKPEKAEEVDFSIMNPCLKCGNKGLLKDFYTIQDQKEFIAGCNKCTSFVLSYFGWEDLMKKWNERNPIE